MSRLQSTFSLAHLLMVIAGLITFLTVAVVLRDRSSVVAIVVAADSLDEGSPAGSVTFGTVEIAANDPLVPFYVSAGADVSGQYLSRPLAKGEPLLLSDLQRAEQAPGHRTMTLPADQLVIRGLGLRVGDLIDLISTTSGGESSFVVAGVEVVRLPSAEALPGFGAAASSSWVTIEVSEQQALAIAAAQASTTVDLVRSSGARPIVIASAPATERSES